MQKETPTRSPGFHSFLAGHLPETVDSFTTRARNMLKKPDLERKDLSKLNSLIGNAHHNIGTGKGVPKLGVIPCNAHAQRTEEASCRLRLVTTEGHRS